MSQIKMASKPTLSFLLINPESEESTNNIPQKQIFYKINSKHKRNMISHHNSAILNSESCGVGFQSQFKQKFKSKPYLKKLNTEAITEQSLEKQKNQYEQKKSPWKFNKNHHQSYTTKSSKKQNFSQQKCLPDSSTKDKQELLCLNLSEVQRNQKFSLITQIRELNISPIENASTYRIDKPKFKKNNQINQHIERSNKIISLIDRNYRKGFFQTQSKKDSLEKLQEKLGLFSYLKRDFVMKKQKLTSEKLKQYFKKPSNSKLEAKINYESRSFLKQKINNDYQSYKQVNELRQNLSKNAIKDEIQLKNKEFRLQFNKKYNIPYLSFMSLPKNLKVKVLQNLTQQNNKGTRK